MATASKNQTQAKRSAAAKKAAATRARNEAQVESKKGVELARERAVQAAETAIDIPVGAALTVYERVNEAIEPLGTPSKRETELRRLRTQLRRELNKVERRGGTARRRALQRAKRTRNRLEREVKQQQRTLETSVKRNRRRAEGELRRLEQELTRNRDQAEKRVREVIDRVQPGSAANTAA